MRNQATNIFGNLYDRDRRAFSKRISLPFGSGRFYFCLSIEPVSYPLARIRNGVRTRLISRTERSLPTLPRIFAFNFDSVMTNSAGIPFPMAEERAAPRSGSSLTGSYLEREEAVVELKPNLSLDSGDRRVGVEPRISKKKKRKKGKWFVSTDWAAFFGRFFNQRRQF